MSCIPNSFLPANFFQLNFPKIADTTLYIQKTKLPSISLGVTPIGTPFSTMKEPGVNLTYDNFTCQFVLDEEFEGYLAVYEWMKGLGFPESFDQYKDLKNSDTSRENLITDAALIVHNASGNAKMQFEFKNIFPIFLGDVDFDVTITNAEPILVPVVFAYDYFKPVRL